MDASTLIDLALSLLGMTPLDTMDPADDPGRGSKPVGG